MEFSVREWTIIVGVLLIVAVFLDGYRRVRNERSNRIRVSLSKQVFNQSSNTSSASDVSDATNPELPNGGARVIGKRRDDLRLQQSVPVLIEPVAVEPIIPEPTFEESVHEFEPEPFVAENLVEESVAEEQLDAFASEPVVESLQTEELVDEDEEVQQREEHDDSPVDVLNLFDAAQPEPKLESPLKPLRNFFARKDSIVVAEPEPEQAETQEVLAIYVLSKDPEGFKGPDLLQLLLACDMRFGKKNIFHRYEKANAKGAIQFSLANIVEPGTFNLDAIDSFTTPGVSFFLSLPGPEKPLTAFNYMVETAQVLVRHLHAELRDDAHSVMTAQTLEHCRQRIRDFERKQLTLQL